MNNTFNLAYYDSLHKLKLHKTPLEMLAQVYKEDLDSQGESRSLESKVMWIALNYVSD